MTTQYLPTKETLANALAEHGNWAQELIGRGRRPYAYNESRELVAVLFHWERTGTEKFVAMLATDLGRALPNLRDSWRSVRHLRVYITESGEVRTEMSRTYEGIAQNGVFFPSHDGVSAAEALDKAMDALANEYAQACEDRAQWAYEETAIANALAHGHYNLRKHSRVLVLSSKKGAHTGSVGVALWAAGESARGTVGLAFSEALHAKDDVRMSVYAEGSRCVSAPVMPFDLGADSARVFCEALFPKDGLDAQQTHSQYPEGRRLLIGLTRLFELLACDEETTHAVRGIEAQYRALREAAREDEKGLDKKSTAKLRAAMRKELAVLVASMRNVLRPLLVECELVHLLPASNAKVQAGGHDEDTNVTYA